MTDSTMTEIPLVERLERLRKYLNGEGDIEGFWFGESADQDARPTFWWRKELPAITEAAAMLKAAVDALEPFAELDGVNMNDPLSKWLRVGHIKDAANTIATFKQPASGKAS